MVMVTDDESIGDELDRPNFATFVRSFVRLFVRSFVRSFRSFVRFVRWHALIQVVLLFCKCIILSAL